MNKFTMSRILLDDGAGQEGGGGGEGAGQQQVSAGQAALSDAGAGGQQQQQAQSQAQVQGQQGAGTQTGSTAQLSAEQIQQIVAGAVKPFVQQAQPQQQQKQWTQDDFNKAFNVWNPGDDILQQFVQNWNDLDANARQAHPLRQALPQIRDGIVKQAVTLAAYQLQDRLQEMEQRFAPVLEHVNEVRREKMKNDFFTEYPALKPYESIALAVGQQIQANAAQSGQQLSVKDAFKLVADETLKALKQAGIDPASPNGAGQGAATQQKGQAHQMNALSRGGQGGAGQSAGQAAVTKSPGMRALS